MNLIYEKMQKEGKIGPFVKGPGGQLVPRPFAEYPKVVRVQRGGKTVKRICASQREELAFKSEGEDEVVSADPVVQERNELAKEVAELQEKLRQMQSGDGTAKPAKPAVIPEAALAGESKKVVETTAKPEDAPKAFDALIGSK